MFAQLCLQVRQLAPPRPVSCLDISQRDLLAATYGCHVQACLFKS